MKSVVGVTQNLSLPRGGPLKKFSRLAIARHGGRPINLFVIPTSHRPEPRHDRPIWEYRSESIIMSSRGSTRDATRVPEEQTCIHRATGAACSCHRIVKEPRNMASAVRRKLWAYIQVTGELTRDSVGTVYLRVGLLRENTCI